jgi:uncharacterized repeat protein (TIGR01451 family)
VSIQTNGLRRRWLHRWLLAIFIIPVQLAFAEPAAILDVEWTSGPASYTPGENGNYTLVVRNTGDADAEDVPVSTNFPGTVTVAWTCVADGDSECDGETGSGNLAGDVTIVADEAVTWTFAVSFDSSMTIDPLIVEATAGGSPPPVNDPQVSDTHSADLEPVTALSVSLDTVPPGSEEYVPGAQEQVRIVVSNDGPSDARGAGVALTTDELDIVTFLGWSCQASTGASCPDADGTGRLDESSDIIAGGSLTFTQNLAYDSDAEAEITHTVSLAVPDGHSDENDPVEHQAALTLEPKLEVNLQLSFETSSLPENLVAGGDGSVSIVVQNDGPSDAAEVVALLGGSPFVVVTQVSCDPSEDCTEDESDGVLAALFSLAAGEAIVVNFEVDVDSRALDDLNLFALALNEFETSESDFSDEVTIDLRREADIEVVKTSGRTVVNLGEAFEYEIRVTNHGPSDVGHGSGEVGILLSDTFSSSLRAYTGECGVGTGDQLPCWRFCPDDQGVAGDYNANPADCPVELISGIGHISNESFRLSAGSSSTVEVFAVIQNTNDDTVENTATVSMNDESVHTHSAGGHSDSSTDVIDIDVSTDIQTTKSAQSPSGVPGETFSYSIEVHNAGFVTANNVNVFDALPLFSDFGDAGFEPGSISWQCQATGGACCNHNSSSCGATSPIGPVHADTLDHGVDLPPGSAVVFSISGTIDPRAATPDSDGQPMINSATATLPDGMTDSNPGNNISTVETTLAPVASLTLDKSVLEVTEADGTMQFSLVYRLLIANHGPSFVSGAALVDNLDGGVLDPTTAQWTCSVLAGGPDTACADAGGSGPLDTQLDLAPDAHVEVLIQVDTVSPASGTVSNTATISSTAGSATGTVETSLIGRARLDVTKTDNRDEAAPGSQVDYVITIRNEGPDDVFGAHVVDQLPVELDDVIWQCEATTPVPGDLEARELVGTAGGAGRALAGTSDGRHIYVTGATADGLGRLFVFDRNNVPGLNFGQVAALETETQGQPDPSDTGGVVSGLDWPVDIALSPDELYIYVLSRPDEGDGDPAIAVFVRNDNPASPNFGKVTFVDSHTTDLPEDPRHLVVTSGNVYVSGDDQIAIFRRDTNSGLPNFDMAREQQVPAAPGPMAIDRGRGLLAIASSTGDEVALFEILPAGGGNPAGRLAHRASATHPDWSGIRDLTLAADGQHLYLSVSGLDRIWQVDYTEQSLSAVASYGGDDMVDGTRLAATVDGEHLLAVSAQHNAMFQFRRDSLTGALSLEEGNAIKLDQPFLGANPGLREPASAIFSSDGRHVLIASASTDMESRPLSIYSRRAPDPLFAFMQADARGDQDGLVAGMQTPNDVAVSPDGQHVYVLSLSDDSLTAFRRAPDKGISDDTQGEHLSYITTYIEGQDGFEGLDSPRRLLISPDGRNVYVTSEDNNTLVTLNRNRDSESPGFGELSPVQGQLFIGDSGDLDALKGAKGIALDSAGRHLYVAGSFDSTIAIFSRNGDTGALEYSGRVRSGENGVSGLGGIRDLAISHDGSQLLGVSAVSDALVVFDRESSVASASFGQLSFVHRHDFGSGKRPVSLAIPAATAQGAGEHVYVALENDNSLAMLRRVTDPANTAFGRVQPLGLLSNNSNGIAHMGGPRSVRVSPDGRRVYVAAQNDSSILVFDRDLNSSGVTFGRLNLIETRRNNVDGVAGIGQIRALAISSDSRNVYAAGFSSSAVASFRLGVGSMCSVGGSGDIDDRIDIGVGGTLVYRISGRLRPQARGTLSNTVKVALPSTFQPEQPDSDCSSGFDFCATDTTDLIPAGEVSVEKTSDTVSVVAGGTARYEIVVRNAGPSNLVHEPGYPLTLTDDLDGNPSLVPGSAVWSCSASGSGALSFIDYYDSSSGFEGVGGVSGLALVPGGSLGSPVDLLASASVLDDSLVLFERHPGDGHLMRQWVVSDGDVFTGGQVADLSGARAVKASSDGRFVYVASRVADSISVFSLTDDGSGAPAIDLVQTERALVGLDQAVHVAISPDENHLYVAGANDDAIAIFERAGDTGLLSYQGAIRHADSGVNGLIDVDHLSISPDGTHVYALSSAMGTVTLLGRNVDTGMLNWLQTYSEASFGVSLAGVSAAVMDSHGEHLYLAAGLANHLVVLSRNGDGELSLASTIAQTDDGVAGLTGVRGLTISADDVHVYATSQSGSSVAWFVRDGADGSLDFGGLRANESAQINGLAGATGVVVDGEDVYVAGTKDNAVVQFQRQADSFCPASGAGSLIDVPFNIATGGSVTFIIDVDVATDFSGTLENTVTVNAARDISGDNLESTASNVISLIADLAISKDDGISEIDGLAGAAAVAGYGDSLYVAATDDNAIGVFRRDGNPSSSDYGSLQFVEAIRGGTSGVTGLTSVRDLTISDDGHHVYAASSLDNAVVTFSRDLVSGRLTFISAHQNGVDGISGLSGANRLALAPDQEHLYVSGAFGNSIAVFRRQSDVSAPDFGHLNFVEYKQEGVDGVDGLASPRALAVTPDGKHVYALGGSSNAVTVFQRNPTSGSASFGRLSYVTHYSNNDADVTGLAGVRDLAIRADGQTVYVLGNSDGTLVQFERDDANGHLEFVEFLQDGFGSTSALAGAQRLHLEADGESVLVVGGQGGTIARYALDADDATLSFAEIITDGDEAPLTGGQVFGLDGASDLWASADGGHVYVTSSQSNALVVLDRESTEPTLSFREILIDGLGGVAPGDAVTYLIIVDNHGPSDVDQARVIDIFPDSFTSVSWSCAGSNGGQCQSSGTGNIDVNVNLPAGARVAFEATGVVAADASGRLINTATVNAAGVTDPNPDNNSATDDDTVLTPVMDLYIDVDDGQDEATPGDWVTYTITAGNIGPSDARNVVIEDVMPPSMHDLSWACHAEPPAGLLSALDTQSGELDTISSLVFSADGQHAYAAGVFESQAAVRAFNRDPVSGDLIDAQLLRQGVDGVTGIRGASDLALSSDGRFLFVAGSQSDAIVVFERDTMTGDLTILDQYQAGDLGIQGLGGVHRLLIGPEGQFLYAASLSDQALSVFAIDTMDGTLTQVGALRQGVDEIDGLNGIAEIRFSDDGEVLYVAATDNESLAAFDRDTINGTLEPAGLIMNFELPGDVLLGSSGMSTHGDRVMVAALDSNLIARFDYDRDSGTFTLVDALDQIDGLILDQPYRLHFEADQSRLYVADVNGLHMLNLLTDSPSWIVSESVAEHGHLQQLSALVPGPSARYFYTVSRVSVHGVGVWARERGSRCAIAGEGTLGRQVVDIVPGGELQYQVTGRLRPNAVGELTYSTSIAHPLPEREINPADNVDSDVNLLVPRPDLGVVKQAEKQQVVAGEDIAWLIEASNAGLSDAAAAILLDEPPVYPDAGGVLSGTGVWSCEANRPLAPVADYSAPVTPHSLIVGGAGHQVYSASPEADALLLFPRLPEGALGTATQLVDGQSTPGGSISGMRGAAAVAVSEDERHVYVAGKLDDSLVVLSRDEPGQPFSFRQKLTSGVDGVLGLRGVRSIVLSADERFVFAAGVTDHTIAVFERSAADGSLKFIERVRDGAGTIEPDFNVIQGIRKLRVDDRGDRLYAVSEQSQSVASFSINSVSGELSYEAVWRNGENGLNALSNARDLVAAPGGTHLYALGEGGIAIFSRSDGEPPILMAEQNDLPSLVDPRAILLDRDATRLYLIDSGPTPTVHMLVRDWSDGTLEYRYSRALPNQLPISLSYNESQSALYISTANPPSVIHLNQRAISRCLDESGETDKIDLTGDLGVGGWMRANYSAYVHPSARGELINTATISPGIGEDPDLSDNSSTTVTPILVVSDLTVTKTGPEEAVAGLGISYEVTVSNSGPSDALGILVRDLAPAELLDISWSCVAAGDSSCPANGNGAPDFVASVMVGQPLTLAIEATIDSAFVGNLVNPMQLTPEPDSTDPNPSGWTDDAVTEVVAIADVSVSKQTLTVEVVAGTGIEYRLRAENAGPSDSPVTLLTDLLPAGLVDVEWQCVAEGQATCPISGSGDIEDLGVSIPAGDAVEFTVAATIDPAATGLLDNSFSAVVSDPARDPDPSNNIASVSDAILVHPDLALSLAAPINPFASAEGQELPIDVSLTNHGPSQARDVILELTLSAGAPATVIPGCVAGQGNTLTCEFGSLEPGQTHDFQLQIGELPDPVATLTVSGEAMTSGDDPNLANNNASVTVDLLDPGDVRVIIDHEYASVRPGQLVEFEISVDNLDVLPVDQVDFNLPVPVNLLDVTWTCTASGSASCTAGGSNAIVDQIALDGGQGVTYRLEGRVNPGVNIETSPTVTLYGQAVVVPPGDDVNPHNNVAISHVVIRQSVFQDGFLAPITLAADPIQDVPTGSQCVKVVAAFSTQPSLATPGPARLLEARAESSDQLAWIDLIRLESGYRVRLGALAENFGLHLGSWHAWSGQSGRPGLRLDAGVPSLLLGNQIIETADGAMPGSPATWWLPELEVFMPLDRSAIVTDCENNDAALASGAR